MSKCKQPALRRTKIVATLGPATDDSKILHSILQKGVDVVRLNFSHGSHADHLRRINEVRRYMRESQRVIGILGDLQGPKIRVANFVERKVELKTGQQFVLDALCPDEAGTAERVGIDYKNLPQDVAVGDALLLDDGKLELCVKQIKKHEIICEVVIGGLLSNHKGINRRGGGLTAPALTEKDRQDLEFAVQQQVDFLAVSFPRCAEEIEEARSWVVAAGGQAGIIAKIERAEAVGNIQAIISASDGVMVARGDLAVEIGDAQVPLVQKRVIHLARALNKPVIVATQMLESMIEATVPTRAEVSDVATAVLENADAVMLSAETASGRHPVLAVEAMDRVCRVVEAEPQASTSRHRVECRFERMDEAIAMATMYTANHLDIKAVLALTESGMTPLLMSRIRTAMPIFGLSRSAKTLGYLSLYRGVYPVFFDVTHFSRDEINKAAVDALRQHIDLEQGDFLILTKGDNLGVGGGTNAMKILVVGEVI